jgi:hypothetical protein
MRVLGPERLLNGVDVSQTGEARLEVELTRLSEVGLSAVVVEGEECRASLDGGLNHAGRGNLENLLLGKGLSELSKNLGSDFEDGGGGLPSEGEMTSIGDEVGSRLLRSRRKKQRKRSARDASGRGRVESATDRGDPVGHSLRTSWGRSDNSPPVSLELVSSRSVSSLGESLDGSDNLDGRLEVQVERVEGFGLGEPSKRASD